MDLLEFRKDYLESVKSFAAADLAGTVESFMKVSCENLVNMDIIPDYDLCFFTGVTRSGKKYRVDGNAFDDFDCSMSLFVSDFSGDKDLSKITKTEAKTHFERLVTFINESLNGRLKSEIEISTPAYDLVERLNHLINTIRKLKLYIITDKEMSDLIGVLPFGKIADIPIEYHIWDIKRFFRTLGCGDGHEHIELNFLKYTKSGIHCLEASDASTDDFKCFLCIIPGSVLSDIYDEYGSRLLEGNVRSFLSTKVAVNRNIRTTILGADKRMFFAYNNGIAATASEIVTEKADSGKYITLIKNLQIVNGGQTTASLSNARFKDKADLDGIFVQMKLTVIKENIFAEEIIPKISRCSNSQNKVSDADFFSNHEFNIRMQQISRRVYAPAVNGAQYETHWFFERARGQYEQEQAKLTPAEKNRYQTQNPKSQLISKTDFAKLRNTWRGYPQSVSTGAQKNFSKFAEYIVQEWEKNPEVFNEFYFRQTISLAILFKHLEKMILKQTWYEQGYRANIVTYTLALLRHLLESKYTGKVLDLNIIWNKQRLPEALEAQLPLIAKHVFKHITNEKRPIVNVTEWCKKELCWTNLKILPFQLNQNMDSCIIDRANESELIREGKNNQKIDNGIDAQTIVVSLGSNYWSEMLRWGKTKDLLNDIDISFIMTATKMEFGRIPSEKQCKRLQTIQVMMEEEGFIFNGI